MEYLIRKLSMTRKVKNEERDYLFVIETFYPCKEKAEASSYKAYNKNNLSPAEGIHLAIIELERESFRIAARN